MLNPYSGSGARITSHRINPSCGRVHNLIFGRLFGSTVLPDVAFASNLFGAFIGGSLEYLSPQIGYHLLLVLVVAAYLLSFAALAYWRGSAVLSMAVAAK